MSKIRSGRRSGFAGRWVWFALAFGTLIGGSLAYDHVVAQVSTTRTTFTARHAKCGPVSASGPKEPQGFRSLKTYFLMARRDDGSLVRVERRNGTLPSCGATLEIAERITPWGTVWYWTDQ
jgi:hypothetical protein